MRTLLTGETKVFACAQPEILEKFGGSDNFLRYSEILQSENSKINLISRETTPAGLEKLIADSLVPHFLSSSLSGDDRFELPAQGQALDIGSGGGLPAIPLSLSYPALKFTMVERTLKKANFLRSLSRKLSLEISVVPADLSEFAISISKSKKSPTKYDLITVRWVRLTKNLLQTALSLLAPGGALLYYSSPQEKDGSDIAGSQLTVTRYRFHDDPPDQVRSFTVYQKL